MPNNIPRPLNQCMTPDELREGRCMDMRLRYGACVSSSNVQALATSKQDCGGSWAESSVSNWTSLNRDGRTGHAIDCSLLGK